MVVRSKLPTLKPRPWGQKSPGRYRPGSLGQTTMTAKTLRTSTPKNRRSVDVLRTRVRNLAGALLRGGGRLFGGNRFQGGEPARDRIGQRADADVGSDLEDELGGAVGWCHDINDFGDQPA